MVARGGPNRQHANLNSDLYRIDLSCMTPNYIGETEGNLPRILGAAENANPIVLFDEAITLVRKRLDAKSSHERYADIEVAYAFQKLHRCGRISILATNHRNNSDESFLWRVVCGQLSNVASQAGEDNHERYSW